MPLSAQDTKLVAVLRQRLKQKNDPLKKNDLIYFFFNKYYVKSFARIFARVDIEKYY